MYNFLQGAVRIYAYRYFVSRRKPADAVRWICNGTSYERRLRPSKIDGSATRVERRGLGAVTFLIVGYPDKTNGRIDIDSVEIGSSINAEFD